jgi:transaldolase
MPGDAAIALVLGKARQPADAPGPTPPETGDRMLLVDTADPAAIADALAFPGVQGFTTNPTLIARAAEAESLTRETYIKTALDLCALAAQRREVRHFMIQSVGDPEDAIAQVKSYAKALPPDATKKFWIKLPPTQAHLNCCSAIAEIGCASLVTAVFTPAQAYVAMEAGADGVAVYLGRLMRTEGDWRPQLERIVGILREAQKLLLLASFQNIETVETGLAFSRHLTLPPALLADLLRSPQAEEAIAAFDARVTP